MFTAEPLAILAPEAEPAEFSREQLLSALGQVFRQAEAGVRSLDPSTLADPRTVGRQHLPITIAGLLTDTPSISPVVWDRPSAPPNWRRLAQAAV